MFQFDPGASLSKSALYRLLDEQAKRLMEGERDWIANASNLAALIFHSLPDVNWVGFYVYRHRELVLGPFQGKPACVRIAIGKGVCGTAAQRRETLVVSDVHAFVGHIACDAASNSDYRRSNRQIPTPRRRAGCGFPAQGTV
jgi:GAF domain-containing protein